MAPRLRRSESGVAGVQRMLRRETKRAVRAMGSGHPPRGEAIHDARKRLKKARAALRLARAALTKDEYRWENSALRDAARPLSDVRDAQALIDRLERQLCNDRVRKTEKVLSCGRQSNVLPKSMITKRVLPPSALSSWRLRPAINDA